MTDVTEIRTGEKALQLSEDRFRHVSGLITDFAFSCTRPEGGEFYIDWIAGATAQITGYTNEEILAMGCWRGIVVEEDRQVFDTRIGNLLPGTSARCDIRIRTKDQKIRWIVCYAECIIDPFMNDLHRMYGGCEDITIKKEAEEEREHLLAAVQEEKEKLSVLLNSIPDEIWFADSNHKFSLVNDQALKEFGLGNIDESDADRLLASLEVLRPDGTLRPLEETPTYRALNGETVTHEIEIVRTPAHGDWRYRQVNATPVKDSQGRIIGAVSVVRDVTDMKRAEKALADEIIRRRILIDQSRDGIVTLDQNGKVFEVNQRFADMLGYSVEEMKDLHVWDWDISIEPDQLQEMIRSVDEKGDHFETRHRRKDGRILDVEISTNAAVFAGEKQIFCVVRDISEKKEGARVLAESETRFRALIQNSSDIIRILDKDGRIVYESPSAERILGYPPGHQIGRDPMEDIHPEDLERVKNDLRDVFDKTNRGIPTEFRIRKADGAYIWVDSIGINLLDVPGINGIVVTTRPIQQRKEAEAALQESEERLRLALEGAGAASWEWHLPNGNAVFSDRFYTMLGYTPGEFPATYEGWSALMHPDDRERILLNLQQQIQKRQSQLEIEYRIRAKDGPWLWILGRGKIVESDDQGDPIRIAGVNIDITNRRLMESEIRSLNAVLEQRVNDRTEALSKANEALEEENAQRLEAEAKLQSSLDEKTMLLKEIHHRVKNNLQIIASLLNLQSRYIKDESTLAAIRESQNRVKAMALVHEKLYRSEDLAHIDLNEYIRFLGNGLFQFYGAKGRGIRFGLDMHDVDVDINTAIPLGLIINELISNSLKYAFPEGRQGEVAIIITQVEHTLTIIFHDNGIGIPEGLDWRNTHSLGLQLVTTLTDQMDGTIELDRTAGTQFTLVLHEKK
jgi:PAS domain S-box-containing protein